MQEIFIRADAGATIGLGHVVRCMALADMLKKGFSITFFCKELPSAIAHAIQEQGYGLQIISNEDFFFTCIDETKIVVTDGYHFDTTHQKQVKAKGAILVCIDDLHDKEFFADLIINHAPGVNDTAYKAQSYTRFALGTEYALLRPSFLQAAKNKKVVTSIETLMICFGGADSKNLTYTSLAAVLSIDTIRKINVVTGAAYPYSNLLQTVIQNDSRICLHHSLNENEMLAVMQQSDAAIVPASGILFEVLAAGCIAFAGYYIDNQVEVYKGFKTLNAIEDLGSFDNIQPVIKNGIAGLSSPVKNIIDGFSGERLSALFKIMAN